MEKLEICNESRNVKIDPQKQRSVWRVTRCSHPAGGTGGEGFSVVFTRQGARVQTSFRLRPTGGNTGVLMGRRRRCALCGAKGIK